MYLTTKSVLFSLLTTTTLAATIPSTTALPAIIPRAQETAAPTGIFITTKLVIITGVTEEHVTIPAKTIEIAIPTCIQTIEPDANGYIPPGECNAIWQYYPNFGAAVAFALAFAALTGLHVWQAARYKKRWCWVIIMAGIWETMAFTFRATSTKYQQNSGVYLVFQIFILLAPIWVNAFAYMTLGRMVYYFIPSHRILGMPAVTLAALFVALDIVSFIVQLVGGSMATPAAPLAEQQRAIHIYMGGIGLQEFFILIFVGLCIQFQRRMRKIKGPGHNMRYFFTSSWGMLLCALYFSLAMISVRIVYRLVEFSGGMGQDNPLTTHEAYFYVLEAVPMFLALVSFNIIHPGRIITGPHSDMPGLVSLKNKFARRQGKELLDDRSDSEVELGPR